MKEFFNVKSKAVNELLMYTKLVYLFILLIKLVTVMVSRVRDKPQSTFIMFENL